MQNEQNLLDLIDLPGSEKFLMISHAVMSLFIKSREYKDCKISSRDRRDGLPNHLLLSINQPLFRKMSLRSPLGLERATE